MAIHSKYNPQAEADRFAGALSAENAPAFIVIGEPGESYLAKPLRERFPNAVLIAVRYTENLFINTDTLWDAVYRPTSGNLAFFLLNVIPDEFFPDTLFISWKPSDCEWPETAKKVREAISKAYELFKSLMYTRTAFGPVWLKNMFTNAVFTKKTCTVHFADVHFLFLAAGSSLERYAAEIKDAPFPALCAGSAYEAARYFSLPVSACISTDGGYWAGAHLQKLTPSIPLFFPLEARVPKSILETNSAGLLSYGSFLEEALFSLLGLPAMPAKRNGSISGTAIELVLAQTSKNVFCLGLDLSSGKSFPHARPHSSLAPLECKTSKLASGENFLQGQRFQNGSLKTYAAWFEQLPPKKASRIFRAGVTPDCAKIKNIKSISVPKLKNYCKCRMQDAVCFESASGMHADDRKAVVHQFLSHIKANIKNETLHSLIRPQPVQEPTDKQIVKEIAAFTAYAKLAAFIKEKTPAAETALKEKCIEELEKLEDRELRIATSKVKCNSL